jgi:RalA-binding protein 1
VFGVSLEESLQVAEIASLPAIVFRCIQYLEAKKADQEEGIYRLSGSSAVIKALKDRFNNGEKRSLMFHLWILTRHLCRRG